MEMAQVIQLFRQTLEGLVDEGAGIHATFNAYLDTGNLFADDLTDVCSSIEAYVEADRECSGLAVTWLPGTNGAPPNRELRTLIGARAPNEVVVVGRCAPEDLDYATEQFRTTRKSS